MKETVVTPDRIETIETRLCRLEEMLAHSPVFAVPFRLAILPPEMKEQRRQLREAAVEPWQHLVRRQHPWRKQLYLKGRNLTARQLVGSMKANQLDEEQAAADHHLPIAAVREAIAYVEGNQELLETESEIERLMLKRGGIARGPQPVP